MVNLLIVLFVLFTISAFKAGFQPLALLSIFAALAVFILVGNEILHPGIIKISMTKVVLMSISGLTIFGLSVKELIYKLEEES